MAALPESVDYTDKDFDALRARLIALVKSVFDRNRTWRVVYRIDADAIVIAEAFAKKTQATPKTVIRHCQERLQRYDEASRGED